jgi:hypothetical protein
MESDKAEPSENLEKVVDAVEVLPETFGQRFAKIAGESGNPVAAWVLVKRDGMILVGGHPQLGKDVLEGLKIVLESRKMKKRIVATDKGLALPVRPLIKG